MREYESYEKKQSNADRNGPQENKTTLQGHELRRKGPNNRDVEVVISDKTVEKIMGPEPIPSLDIEMSLIKNELQRKMVEEI